MIKIRKQYIFIALIAYIFLFYYFAFLNRELMANPTIRLNLFKCPEKDGYKDIFNNIVLFFPIGVLTGLFFEKYRIVKALALGLIVSLSTEFSQLIWHRGIFDVNDLFNNTVGAVVGGVMVCIGLRIKG